MDIIHVIDFSAELKHIGEALFCDLEARSAQYFSNKIFVTATFLDQRYKRFRFIK